MLVMMRIEGKKDFMLDLPMNYYLPNISARVAH